MALTDWYCEEVLTGKLQVDRIFEDERVLAFYHPRPAARPHVVVIPKQHVPSLLDQKALDGSLLESMIRALQHAVATVGLDRANGFYLRANAAAPGVTPHMHWHVLPGAGTNWPQLKEAAIPLLSPAALSAYSEEHLKYEVSMFFGAVASRSATLASPNVRLLAFMVNARTEAFANHLRNLIVFLYPDEYPVRPGDVCGDHFIDAPDPRRAWVMDRKGLSTTLKEAKIRADKELAHLTVSRRDEGSSDKQWDLVGLAQEVRELLHHFLSAADPARLHASVATEIPEGNL